MNNLIDKKYHYYCVINIDLGHNIQPLDKNGETNLKFINTTIMMSGAVASLI